jgi:hypothetical protein
VAALVSRTCLRTRLRWLPVAFVALALSCGNQQGAMRQVTGSAPPREAPSQGVPPGREDVLPTGPTGPYQPRLAGTLQGVPWALDVAPWGPRGRCHRFRLPQRGAAFWSQACAPVPMEGGTAPEVAVSLLFREVGTADLNVLSGEAVSAVESVIVELDDATSVRLEPQGGTFGLAYDLRRSIRGAAAVLRDRRRVPCEVHRGDGYRTMFCPAPPRST